VFQICGIEEDIMKMRWMIVPALLLATGIASPEPQKPARPADALRGMDEIAAQMAQLDQCHARMVELNEKMAAVFSSFRQKAGDVIRSAASSGGSNSTAQLMQATQQMQEMQMSFNLQYLQLQNQMQNENRQYTSISNIMKTKHDTVKNTISNIH
jgi:hypothetical protein